MAKYTRKNPTLSFEIDIQDEGLRAFFSSLAPARRRAAYKAAIQKTLVSVQRLSISAASAQGFAQTGPASNNGWDWERRGRLPKAITVGKVWANTGIAGGRVYTKTAKGAGDDARSPAANAFITGYRQMIPTGLPGKGQVRFSKDQPARPVYRLVAPLVKRIFVDNLNRSIRTMLSRRSKRA